MLVSKTLPHDVAFLVFVPLKALQGLKLVLIPPGVAGFISISEAYKYHLSLKTKIQPLIIKSNQFKENRTFFSN